MDHDSRSAVIALLAAITEMVEEMGPAGAPAGPLYAALMTKGCSLDQFQMLMGVLVQTKRLRESGHVYYFVSKFPK